MVTQKKLPFDTLELATLLENGGVEKANIHAASLAAVITQNLYTKNEIDKMNEALLARFDASLRQTSAKFEASLRQTSAELAASLKEFRDQTIEQNHKFTLALERNSAKQTQDMLELEARMEKRISRSIYTAFAICGTLITTISTAVTLAGRFIH